MKRIALVGNPNCGKTTLFNEITGLRHKVANYSGVTVELHIGKFEYQRQYEFEEAETVEIIDLPGIYGFVPVSADEAVCVDFLEGRGPQAHATPPDLIIAVVDATHLSMNLGLVLGLRRYARPMVVALNMFDLAQARSLPIDIAALSEALGCPVVPTTAVGSAAKASCANLMRGVAEKLKEIPTTTVLPPPSTSEKASFFTPPISVGRQVSDILQHCVPALRDLQRFSTVWDHWLLHPVWGGVVMFFVLGLMFQAIFVLGSGPSDAIRSFFDGLGQTLAQHEVLPHLLGQLLIKGVLPGTGLALSFLPQVALLSFFIAALEGGGYLPRMAFLLDGLMGHVGLSGRAFIPLLSSFSCAVPGIVATRMIAHPRERLITILIAPLMTCSARLPVYTLLIAAFVPHGRWAGLDQQGLVLFGLYLFGLVGAALTAGLLRHGLGGGGDRVLLMELPTYRWPHWRDLALEVWSKMWLFMRRVLSVIPPLGMVLWFLCNYPLPPVGSQAPAITFSWAGQLADALSNWWKPLGFNREIAIALIPGLWAREVAIGSLATVYGVQSTSSQSLSAILSQQWMPATGYALLAWYVFAPQCLSTLVVVQRETKRWWPPIFILVYLFGLAYGAAALTYQLTRH
jgi:ferrous iron transport protein B